MYRRKPVVAGSFYPSRPSDLEHMVNGYLDDAASAKVNSNIIGLISPHAGYIYSGPIAGYSFAQLRGMNIDTAIVLAPSHRARFKGASVIPEGDYVTPLGDVPIDGEIGKLLVEKPDFGFAKEAHEFEHSLEVQVPFLQRVLNDFTIVPIIIGTTDVSTCKTIAEGITDIITGIDKNFIIIVSTDLSHYYGYDAAKSLDNKFIESLKTLDEKKLSKSIDSRESEACGEGPVLTGIMVCKQLGATGVEILKYANSGDTAGTKDQVVGYLSAAFVK